MHKWNFLSIFHTEGAPKILYSTGSAILAYNPEAYVDEEEIVIANPSFAIGIDYHYKKGIIFWTDRDENKVN